MTQAASRAEQARTNSAIADAFLDCVFNRRDMACARQLLAADFRHHEPGVAPGADGLLAHLAGFLAEHPDLRLEVVRHICDGDFVVVHNRRSEATETSAAIDVLRMEDDKVAEAWEVFQQVPDVIANPNGMF